MATHWDQEPCCCVLWYILHYNHPQGRKQTLIASMYFYSCFMGSMLSCYQYDIHKSSQILRTGPLKLNQRLISSLSRQLRDKVCVCCCCCCCKYSLPRSCLVVNSAAASLSVGCSCGFITLHCVWTIQSYTPEIFSCELSQSRP